MLFRRKKPPDWWETFRIMLWPRRSWVRSGKYVAKRILRLTASPHAIAAGVGAGVFASFTPLFGFHFLLAFTIAYLVAGNFLAAALGTFFGNPLTFPFIWASTYKTGNFILYGPSAKIDETGPPTLEALSTGGMFEHGFGFLLTRVENIWHPLFKPMLVGSFPLGVTFGIIAYVLTRWAAGVFKEARRRQLQKRAQREGRDAVAG